MLASLWLSVCVCVCVRVSLFISDHQLASPHPNYNWNFCNLHQVQQILNVLNSQVEECNYPCFKFVNKLVTPGYSPSPPNPLSTSIHQLHKHGRTHTLWMNSIHVYVEMSHGLVVINLYWSNSNHDVTRRRSLSGCLEDCCQPPTTVGNVQPCEGTNLAPVLYHPRSGDQKPQLPPAAVRPQRWFQQIAHKTQTYSKTEFSLIYLNLHPPTPPHPLRSLHFNH